MFCKAQSCNSRRWKWINCIRKPCSFNRRNYTHITFVRSTLKTLPLLLFTLANEEVIYNNYNLHVCRLTIMKVKRVNKSFRFRHFSSTERPLNPYTIMLGNTITRIVYNKCTKKIHKLMMEERRKKPISIPTIFLISF